jgi:hypothetical protein
MDWTDRLHELIGLFFIEVINPILPNARAASAGATSSPEVMPNKFDLRISTSEMFFGSAYSVDRNQDYLHFTRLAALERIIEDKVVLASSISAFSDKDEVHYGMNAISGVSGDVVKKVLENTYVLSLVEDGKMAVKDHFMWNVYGDFGKGAYLRFEVPTVKYPFSFGKVLYGESELKGLFELDARIESFKKKYNLSAKEIEVVWIHLAACHKPMRFESEKEVRLIYSKDYEMYGALQYLPTKAYISRDGVIRNALKIPVRILSKDDFYAASTVTDLLLKEIVLGYAISDEEIQSTLDLLRNILPTNPQVKIFRLNKELKFIPLYSF